MDQIEQTIMQRWLKHFKLRFHQAHASGHCSPTDLKWLIEKINPETLIPVHTEHSGIFNKVVKTKIIRPKYEKSIEIKLPENP